MLLRRALTDWYVPGRTTTDPGRTIMFELAGGIGAGGGIMTGGGGGGVVVPPPGVGGGVVVPPPGVPEPGSDGAAAVVIPVQAVKRHRRLKRIAAKATRLSVFRN